MKLLLYPENCTHRRWPFTVVRRYVESLNIQLVTDPKAAFDVALYFSFHRTVRPWNAVLRDMVHRGVPVLNSGCLDITKSRNEVVMKTVFGYNTIVDPMVTPVFGEKIEEQGRHSITIMRREEFTARKPNHIYVKLINSIYDGLAEAWRVYVFGGRVVFAYRSMKPEHKRFGRSSAHVSQEFTQDFWQHFTRLELDGIEEYCKMYPVEYTELDVLRDRDDGRIYIVDNNNMPAMGERTWAGLNEQGWWPLLCEAFMDMLHKAKKG